MNEKTKFRVILFHCGNENIVDHDDNAKKNIFFMPMGLFAMASRLREKGFESEIINSDLHRGTDIKEVIDFDTLDAVGLDLHWANQSYVVTTTIELLKSINPDLYVFLGGYTASFFAEEILSKYPTVDAVIRGDGEVPIVELCKVLRDKKANKAVSLEKVPNLVWRGDNNKIIFNEFSYVGTVEEMESLDFAAIDLLKNWELYRKLGKFWTYFEPINSQPLFFLEVGRGCIYGCSFCGGNAKAQSIISKREGQILRSVDSVIATIKKALSFGFTCFYSCFESEESEEWYLELFKRIKEEKLKISYAYGSWGLPSKKLVDAMAETFEYVLYEFSPETADLDLRKKNKDIRLFYTNDEMEEILDYTKNNYKNTYVQLYFGHFLSADTEETVFSTLRYISKIYYKYFHFTEIVYGNLSTDPASLLYLDPGKYGVELNINNFQDYIGWILNFYLARSNKPRDLTLFLPRDFSGEDFNRLSNKINLFNTWLFNLSEASLLLLKKVGDTNIITDYLREIGSGKDMIHDYTIEEAKELFLDTFKKYIEGDSEIIEAVNVVKRKSKK